MLKLFLAGLAFWLLSFLFPTITIAGFWTITGVVFLFGFLNVAYKLTIGQFLIPFRFFTLGFLTTVINTGFVYLLESWFNLFTIEPGTFWWTLLFTLVYSFVVRVIYS